MTDLRQQTFDEVRRSRATDPATSKTAARFASGLGAKHNRAILAVLRCGDSLTAGEIAQRCGLTSLQVSRRLGQLRDDGHVVVDPDRVGRTPAGRPAMCWKVAT